MMEQTPLSPIFWNKVLGGGSPGPTPSGTISINENGTYNVAAFAEAKVNVQGGESDVIQMRGTYTLRSIDGLDINNIKIRNFEGNITSAQFICVLSTVNLPDGLLSIYFSGKDVFCGPNSFNLQQAIGVIKELGVYGSDGTKMLISTNAQTFRGQRNLQTISIPVYSGSATSWDRPFVACYALEYINFIPNRWDYPLPMADCSKLTNDGLVALGNGLLEGAAKTVTLHATPKAHCAQILGTVSEITEDDVTYHVFTQDDSGSVTLTEFITTVKGWTLA